MLKQILLLFLGKSLTKLFYEEKMKTLKMLLFFIISISIPSQVVLFAQESENKEAIDPKIVLEKYIEAIGGRDIISKVEDRTTIMRGTAMGQALTIIVKQKAPNKMRQEVKAGGMDQTIIFDGEKGIMKAATQNVEVTGKELEQLKIEATLNLILDPENYGLKITYEGNEKVNNKAVEKLKYTLPSGIRWFEFYDSESGLKVKEEKEMQTQMGLIQQVVTFENYTEVDGMKYPFKLTQSFGPQSVEMTVSSIKVNKGLSDDIFVIAE